MDAFVLLFTLGVLLAVGMPVAFAVGLSAVVGALYIDLPLEALMIQITSGVNKFSLLAIPFFILAGAIMAEGGIARRLVNFAYIFVGFIRGGLSLVNIVASYDRTRLTGSYNRSGYSNAGIDALIARAGGTMDDAAREALLRQAVAESIDDLAIIPLYQLANFWVARRGITYQATAYDHTSAVLARRRR